MQLPALCCGASLLLLVLPWAGAQPVGGEHGAELRSLQVPGPGRAGSPGAATRTRSPCAPAAAAAPLLSFPLQDLMEALGQLQEEEGEQGLEEEPMAGAEDGGFEWDLPGAESGPAAAPLPAPSTPQPAEGQSQWRSLLSSYRRRHFSGCFGTRMERIGAQTGLGCNQYKARRCRVRARGSPRRREAGEAGEVAGAAAGTGRCPRLKAPERVPQQLSALLSQVSGGEGEAEAGIGSQALPEPPGRCPAARQPGSPRSPRGGAVCGNKL